VVRAQHFFVGAVRGAQRFQGVVLPRGGACSGCTSRGVRDVAMARAWSADRSPRSRRAHPGVCRCLPRRSCRRCAALRRRRVHGEQLISFAVMRFAWPVTRRLMASTICSISARGSPARPPAAARPPTQRGPRVNALLSMRATMRASRADQAGCARGAARALRAVCAPVQFRPRASARHSSFSSATIWIPAWRPRGFLRAASCWRSAPSTTTRLLRAHSRSRVERRDHAVMHVLATRRSRPSRSLIDCTHSKPARHATRAATRPDR